MNRPLTGATKLFYTAAAALLCLSLAWKIEATFVWRLTHRSSASVAGKKIELPFPWMLTRTQSSIKARAFVTLWPTPVTSEEDELIIEQTPLDQLEQSDAAWITERTERFVSNGYSDVHSSVYENGGILCSEANKGQLPTFYCRSKSQLNLVYAGPANQVQSAIAILSTH